MLAREIENQKKKRIDTLQKTMYTFLSSCKRLQIDGVVFLSSTRQRISGEVAGGFPENIRTYTRKEAESSNGEYYPAHSDGCCARDGVFREKIACSLVEIIVLDHAGLVEMAWQAGMPGRQRDANKSITSHFSRNSWRSCADDVNGRLFRRWWQSDDDRKQ